MRTSLGLKTAGTAARPLLETVLATLLAAGMVRLQLSMGGGWARLAPAVWIYLPLLLGLASRRPLASSGFSAAAWVRGGRSLAASVALVLAPFFVALLALRRLRGGAAGLSPALPGGEALLFQLLLIAVPEEIFFRGYVQGRLQSSSGCAGAAPWGAIVVSALLFALAHVLVEPGWMRAAAFFPGLVLGWLRWRTGGLLAPTGFHWLSNLLAIQFGL